VGKKKPRLTAIEKTRKALERLKLYGWILDFGIIKENSLHDSLGYDAWVSFRAPPKTSRNKKKAKEIIDGKFPFQVLSKTAFVDMHLTRHPGIPYVIITRGVTVRDAEFTYLLFLFKHYALNFDKMAAQTDNMSMLCPLKCKKQL